MMELTSIDVHYAAKEMQSLVGAKVEKIVQSDTNKRDVLFSLYLRDHPKVHLRFLLPDLFCTVAEKPDAYPTVPPGFAMFLRKYLGGTRIAAVRQRGFDRILEIDFASKETTMTLVIEFIPPGNMILLLDGAIKNLLENQQFKDRTLRGGKEYVAPPPSFDLAASPVEEIAQRIAESTRESIVKTLAIHMGLGGAYAEEVCTIAGIDKGRSDLTSDDVARVARSVKELFAQQIAPSTDGNRVYPFMMRSRDATTMHTQSFLEALATIVPADASTNTEEKGRVQEQKSRGSKLQSMVTAQTAQVKAMEKVASDEQRKAERVYEEYALLSAILTAAKGAREQKKDVMKALKEFPQCRSYDPATGMIEVELDDA